MKILLTGGGSGGHFYPLIAVAQQIRLVAEDKKILQPDIIYVSDKPYDEDLLFKNDISFRKVSSGKIRRYFSITNVFDIFKTSIATMKALFLMFSIYPDVVFSNGGFASFPMLFAAKIFRIPVVIHISDTVPGKVNNWAAKFAKKISIGFPDAGKYFPAEKVAYTGNPIRKGLLNPLEQGAHEFLGLDKEVPTILILGGSLGSQVINNVIVDILPTLVEKYQIIHQSGKYNFEDINARANLVLEDSLYKKRYKPFKYLEMLALRMAVGASDLVISRAGASSISEISVWGKPSILIPISESANDHQRINAFSYARTSGAVVVEEKNLSSNLLIMEIDRIISDEDKKEKMSKDSRKFAKPEAAKTIADEILKLALKHENK